MSATHADQIVRYKGFNVEISGVDGTPAEVTSNWATVSGGVLGGFGPPIQKPEYFEEELVLRGPVAPEGKSFPRWLNDTQNGGDPYRTVTITLIPLDNDPKLRETITFYDAFLTGYVLPRLEFADPCPDPPIEEVRFSFGRWIRVPG